MEKASSKTCTVLVVAAGTGARMGGSVPKQYQALAGKMLLRRTIDAFLTMKCVSGIHIVINPLHKEYAIDALKDLKLPSFISGGSSRQKSVYNGLKSLDLKDEDIVLIHDAARPFIDENSVLALLEALDTHRAATLSMPLVETTVHSKNGCIDPARPVNRALAHSLQTPQGFRYGDILKAHQTASGAEATDDTSLIHAIGIDTFLVAGSPRNIKITTHDDLRVAERMIASSTETRTGTGYDVHAFMNKPAQTIRLCGIDVPHDRALEGHSDADVGLHALTDALLGAIGENDIGVHFPPSDLQWKGADSVLFLKKADKFMRSNGGRLVNADITIICERPKLGEFRQAMRERIAEILMVETNRINIKATTTEKLGFTGRGEGIAAQATASVEISSLNNS